MGNTTLYALPARNRSGLRRRNLRVTSGAIFVAFVVVILLLAILT